MADLLSTLAGASLRAAIVPLVANEVRGVVLAAPILYGMYESGGQLMALWIGFCSLCGISLSVAAPLFLARRLKPAGAARASHRTGRFL